MTDAQTDKGVASAFMAIVSEIEKPQCVERQSLAVDSTCPFPAQVRFHHQRLRRRGLTCSLLRLAAMPAVPVSATTALRQQLPLTRATPSLSTPLRFSPVLLLSRLLPLRCFQQSWTRTVALFAQLTTRFLCRDHDQMYKLVMVGDAAVGKSSLLQRFTVSEQKLLVCVTTRACVLSRMTASQSRT